MSNATITIDGALLAIASGGLTSGLGCVVWYSALSGHSATSAAIVQFAVPVLAAAGAVGLLARLSAAALTLGGVALALLSSRRTHHQKRGDLR